MLLICNKSQLYLYVCVYTFLVSIINWWSLTWPQIDGALCNTHTQIHSHTDIHTLRYTHTQIYTHSQIHTQIYTQIHIQIYTQTHTQPTVNKGLPDINTVDTWPHTTSDRCVWVCLSPSIWGHVRLHESIIDTSSVCTETGNPSTALTTHSHTHSQSHTHSSLVRTLRYGPQPLKLRCNNNRLCIPEASSRPSPRCSWRGTAEAPCCFSAAVLCSATNYFSAKIRSINQFNSCMNQWRP